MSSKKRRAKAVQTPTTGSKPWIQLRTGLILIGVLSLVFGTFTAYQVWSAVGWREALLWGLGGAGAVWLAFGVSLLINVITRGTDFLRFDR